MQQGREDTGLDIISFDVIMKATLDFNQAMKYMSERLTDITSDNEDLSSFVDTWWGSNLSKVYRALRLSLEAKGGPEVSLFYLQTRVLDAIWNSCFSLRGGPSPWESMTYSATKYRVNGNGDCIVTWNTILRDLQEDPTKAERVLVSPRGAIEYNTEVAHKGAIADHKDAVDGITESEAGPQRVASQAGHKRKHNQAGHKRKHDQAGQKGVVTQNRQKKRRVSPDFEHRNADVEDDSSDFDAKSEEDQAVNLAGSQITATGTDENTKLSDSTAGSGSQPAASTPEVSKGKPGSGPDPTKTLAGTGKSTKLPQSTPDSNSQPTTTPCLWDFMNPTTQSLLDEFMKPNSFPSTRPSKTPNVGSRNTKTFKAGSQSTKTSKAGSQSTKTSKAGGPSAKLPKFYGPNIRPSSGQRPK